jgi:acyl-coenzyme A thioesterase PaaI-like protein
MKIDTLLNKASESSFYKWFANLVLSRVIPFNGAHNLYIISINENKIVVTLPYIRRNKNHVNGIHACALATLCEYTSGLVLSKVFSPHEYRIILKDIEVNYHFQAKMKVNASYCIQEDEIANLKKIILSEDAALKWCIVNVYDYDNNHICTGKIHWQIKPWSKTHSKL